MAHGVNKKVSTHNMLLILQGILYRKDLHADLTTITNGRVFDILSTTDSLLTKVLTFQDMIPFL